jgi:hypothetical protein
MSFRRHCEQMAREYDHSAITAVHAPRKLFVRLREKILPSLYDLALALRNRTPGWSSFVHSVGRLRQKLADAPTVETEQGLVGVL